jgi:RNase P subunit RPR2
MTAMCPRCDAPMKIKTIIPTMFTQTVDEIVYVCVSCGDEAKRSVRRSE